MFQTKKTFLHAGQKKCVPAVSVLQQKSVLLTLKIYFSDVKCTALFTGHMAHSNSFLHRNKSIYPNSTVMGSYCLPPYIPV